MKKFSAVLIAMLMVSMQAFAFTFPEPDWGALLEEKKSMVTEVDFELFAEGSTGNAPYYGQRLEPKSGVYFGAVAETSEVFENVGAYLTYFEVDAGQMDIYYPANEIIRNSDAITVVALNLNDINAINYNVIRSELNTLAGYNKPMIIRFANEMNVSAIGNDPAVYVSVFRTVADMIHEYDNFAVVWSPNDLGGLDRDFHYYYPGDEYVDWVGVSNYQKKYFQGNAETSAVDETYFMTGKYSYTTNALKPIIRFMEKNNIKKELDILIDARGVFSGGVDITDAVIQRLNANGGMK